MTNRVTSERDARFANRQDAGWRLAERLLPLAPEHPVIVALPRGGVPVAREIALALDAPLDILAVRKLGAPHNPEYGIGALAEDGTRVIDPEAIAVLGIDRGALESIVARETAGRRWSPLEGCASTPTKSSASTRRRSSAASGSGIGTSRRSPTRK